MLSAARSTMLRSQSLRQSVRFSVRTIVSNTHEAPYVDLRSDTITRPTPEMLNKCLSVPLGDDVFGEDPTVALLENALASQFNKEAALYFPSGTMSNLTAVMSHCDVRGSEMITGRYSHLAMYEAGNVSTIGGVHSKQVRGEPRRAERREATSVLAALAIQ